MELHLKCGMHLTRGVNIWTLARKEFGLKGNHKTIYQKFCEMHDSTSKRS